MKLPQVKPRTIRAQLMLVVLLAVVSVTVTGQIVERTNSFDYNDVVDMDLIGQRALTIAYLLDGADQDQKNYIIRRSSHVGIDVAIMKRSEWDQLPGPTGLRSKIGAVLAYLFPPDEVLPDGSRVVILEERPVLSLPINDGEVLLYKSYPDSVFTTDFTGRLLYYSLTIATLGFLFSVFAVRFLTAPLTSIASQIDDTDVFLAQRNPLSETGNVEIARLARALNDMRTRIHEMMRGRTAMLRSVSHDLRTPLTRVRLRAERIEDAVVRGQILSDIQQINAMIDVTLDYLREDRTKEIKERTDVASIMQTICDDFSDIGAKIRYRGPGRLIWHCKPVAITRAITNLCENGIKFGGEVEMDLSTVQDSIVIEIRDAGPGIPAEFKTRILEPFFQIDAARTKNGEQTGFGLGLSIVDEIVRDHGGKIEFDDVRPHGL
ncbi:sensor histidine kinase [Agrobacterium rosae]|uniref:sensor histidine kinase n=1 Tax=Agrobacterium rosae TaxID=1972867 RepID=UPI003B9DE3E0